MGKIHKVVIPKHERVKTESKPPSTRRLRRAFMRGDVDHRTKVGQHIPHTVVLKLKKGYYIYKVVVDQHFSDERKDTTRKITIKKLTAPLSSKRANDLRKMADMGMGDLHVQRGRTIWHDASAFI